jgi:hypothetical protein
MAEHTITLKFGLVWFGRLIFALSNELTFLENVDRRLNEYVCKKNMFIA